MSEVPVTIPPYLVHPRSADDADQRPWSLTDYRLFELRQVAGLGEGVKVGICDTGIDRTHSTGALPVADAKSFVGGDVYDQHFHGTHVAGTIASEDYGLAPKVEPFVAKVLGRNGSGSDRSVAEGIEWCLSKGCHIINLSLGSGAPSQVMEAACRRAREAGVVVVAATGNESASRASYPARYSGYAVGVGAIDEQKRLASFSNRGEAVDLVGPGVRILSLSLNGGVQVASGTSMATPWVSGLLALRMSAEISKFGEVETTDFESTLFEVRGLFDDLGRSGRDVEYGRGVPAIEKFLTSGLDDETEDGRGKEVLSVYQNPMSGKLSGYLNDLKIW